MEQSLFSVEKVERMKKALFPPSADLFARLPISAYETAWVAMVPDPDHQTRPMFPKYLDWILGNQNPLGFWFEDQIPEQECGRELDHHEPINYKHQWNNGDFMATLASLIALKTWKVRGSSYKIEKGLKFLEENMEELVKMRPSEDWVSERDLQNWLLMVELAKAKGLKINDVEYKMNVMKFKRRKGELIERVLMREIAFGMCINSEPFGSPSAAACAFMITGGKAYRSYLQHLATNCQMGAPTLYIVDEDVRQLYVVDSMMRFGGAEHFTEEIADVMHHQYRKWMLEESKFSKKDDAALQIYKDSLAFRLLIMHGYKVSPGRFCWFYYDGKMGSYMIENHHFFFASMDSVQKAFMLAFPEDQTVGFFASVIVVMGFSSVKSQNNAKIPANIN